MPISRFVNIEPFLTGRPRLVVGMALADQKKPPAPPDGRTIPGRKRRE
jgi:hypothetical protein